VAPSSLDLPLNASKELLGASVPSMIDGLILVNKSLTSINLPNRIAESPFYSSKMHLLKLRLQFYGSINRGRIQILEPLNFGTLI